MEQNKGKLEMWKERYTKAYNDYQDELQNIKRRDDAYNGYVEPIQYIKKDEQIAKDTHIRNIIAEIIESEVDTAIPQPKVTAKRKEDERLAKLIEDMLRDELDRMPFEMLNDWAERIVPIQGSAFYLCEWDNTERSHTTVGENKVSGLNPKQVIPQAGIYDMDELEYVFVLLPQTKDYIKRRYGVEFDENDAEEAPEVRSSDDAAEPYEDLVTQYIAYYRNDQGGVGMYSWVLDKVLCDYDDYQARRLKRCKSCGKVISEDTDEKVCSACGGKAFENVDEDYETITAPLRLYSGEVIPASQMMPVRVPYYKPDIFPVVMHRNVSSFGRLLGNSDVDLIIDQQRTTNRIEARIIEKLLTGGTYTTLPSDATIRTDNAIGKTIMIDDPAKKSLIGSFDLTCDIEQELVYLGQIYEEARQVIGITDSFQGRKDSTATSKVAKEFAAKQTAGRLESKRQMKNYAYSKLFEIMFKFRLAYADEPRPIRAVDKQGEPLYEEFNRYDFLRIDSAGEFYWNDEFTFSVDSSAPLASNREAMWQETRMNLESGAFGNPQSLETLILFWGKMEMLHYPGSAETKQYLIEQKQKQEQLAQMQMQQQSAQMSGLMQSIDSQARAAAEADAKAMQVQAGMPRGAM